MEIERRVRLIRPGDAPPSSKGTGPVLYWMHRTHRAHDNEGLEYATLLARRANVPVVAGYCLVPRFLGAARRQFGFLLKGLAEVERTLRDHGLPFFFRMGDPPAEIATLAEELSASAIVTDFDPLRIKRSWLSALLADPRVARLPVYEADGRNVVPCWLASDKKEYMARTIRPKIQRLLPEFLTEPSGAPVQPSPWPGPWPQTDWAAASASLAVDESVPEIDWLPPGESGALSTLETFIHRKLGAYATARNDPSQDGLSNLSPSLHFGHLSARRACLAVSHALHAPAESRDAFLEETIIRRELSDNFCAHEPNYDSAACFPDWARKTLAKHAADSRPVLYAAEELEAAATHDDLWNAAQTEMVLRGKMHGYLRMYWGKKILEWSASPEEAMAIAVRLNDRYELDGRDSNGYVGCAWSIGGVHDRPWGERPIFGTVRYMSYNGAKSKFDVAAYVRKINDLKEQTR